MDKYKEESLRGVLDKIRKRDELQRNYFRNKVDIERLTQANEGIEKEKDEMDRNILIMHKPKGE